MRARQKLLLDALVIKKAGEAGAGVDLLAADQEESDETGDIGKLSMAELCASARPSTVLPFPVLPFPPPPEAPSS